MAKETYHGRVRSNRLSTAKVYETWVELVEPAEFHYKAGQFITIPVAEKTLRSYSIASPAGDPKHFLLIVDVGPGGPGSVYFRQLKQGDAIDFQGPYGAFWVRPDSEPSLLFVGTGTGIAPIRGMLHELFEAGAGERPITLFYGVRHREDLIFHDEFQKMAAEHPSFRYFATLSQPRPGTWDGMVGRVTAHLPHYVTGVDGMTAFLCGSKEMLKDVRELLMARGMDRKKIKQEQFY
jgi:NAD(P)H-flavin reductase